MTQGAKEPGRRSRSSQQDGIEAVALALLDAEGPAAVTTRAVSAGAGVQPMTLYRLFGDMDGLLQAATARGFAEYVAAKTDRPRADDPVDDLRDGWDLHVGYGLAHPYVYAQIYGRHTPGSTSPAAEAAAAILRTLVDRAAAAGRLTRDPASAATMIHSAGCGVTLTLMATPPEDRDMAVSTACREAVLAAVTTGPADGPGAAPDPDRDVRTHAVALASLLGRAGGAFSDAEAALLREWLARLA